MSCWYSHCPFDLGSANAGQNEEYLGAFITVTTQSKQPQEKLQWKVATKLQPPKATDMTLIESVSRKGEDVIQCDAISNVWGYESLGYRWVKWPDKSQPIKSVMLCKSVSGLRAVPNIANDNKSARQQREKKSSISRLGANSCRRWRCNTFKRSCDKDKTSRYAMVRSAMQTERVKQR